MNGSDSSDQTLPGGQTVGNSTTPLQRPYPFLSAPQADNEIGRLGDYRVLRLLGSGGMGLVFEAEELALHRRVALKVLKPELAADKDNRERFLREARAAAAINSDHVVTIFQVADSEAPYLAMQFLEGESLQSRIERPRSITLRAALEITRQTADGLAAAHALGLVHRDIKPANLWLETRTDSSGVTAQPKRGVLRPPSTSLRVKILDFGLVRRTTGEVGLTSTGFIVGTPNYMSPEQASGAVLDGRADLFSLGCVLYTMLTGELPFPGHSAMAVMMSLANKTPPPVNEKNPNVPAEVAELVSRMLEKDPAKRPASARDVVIAVDQLLAGLSGSTPLPGLTGAAVRTSRVPDAVSRETVMPGKSDTLARTSVNTPVHSPTMVLRTRRSWAAWGVLAVILVIAGIIGVRAFHKDRTANDANPGQQPPEPILVGILHSQSGTMALSEKPVIDATILAIEELNAAGGVLGRPVKYILADGKSDPDEFGLQAKKLLEQDQVAVIFGCWTSASRKAVRLVVERGNGLLFYPVQYEGLEQSPRIVYLGPAPNQQLIPGVEYLTKTLGKKKLFLVGSDYVFPRAAHEIIRDHVVKALPNVIVVGDVFIPLGSTSAREAVKAIEQAGPDAIINTINGTTNFHFFQELHRVGSLYNKVPTLSVSITENEVKGLTPSALADNYLVGSYFQTIDRPESNEFIRKLRARYGPDAVATDQMAAAYSGVHLWAKAAKQAGTPDSTAVLATVRGMKFDGPRAEVQIDAKNLHTWLPVLIGKIRSDGLVNVVPDVGSATPIAPIPFPDTRTPEKWDEFLRTLQFSWNGKWQAPDK